MKSIYLFVSSITINVFFDYSILPFCMIYCTTFRLGHVRRRPEEGSCEQGRQVRQQRGGSTQVAGIRRVSRRGNRGGDIPPGGALLRAALVLRSWLARRLLSNQDTRLSSQVQFAFVDYCCHTNYLWLNTVLIKAHANLWCCSRLVACNFPLLTHSVPAILMGRTTYKGYNACMPSV